MVQLGAAYWYAKYFTQQLSILAPSCAFVMQLSKCNLCYKHHTYERGHIWSQCTIKSYAKLRQHVNIKLGGISGTYVAKLDRLGLSWIMKSTLQFWLNQWTQTLLTSADIGYMCHSVLYISIGQARDMSFSVASLPSLSLFQSISTIIDSCYREDWVGIADWFVLFISGMKVYFRSKEFEIFMIDLSWWECMLFDSPFAVIWVNMERHGRRLFEINCPWLHCLV